MVVAVRMDKEGGRRRGEGTGGAPWQVPRGPGRASRPAERPAVLSFLGVAPHPIPTPPLLSVSLAAGRPRGSSGRCGRATPVPLRVPALQPAALPTRTPAERKCPPHEGPHHAQEDSHPLGNWRVAQTDVPCNLPRGHVGSHELGWELLASALALPGQGLDSLTLGLRPRPLEPCKAPSVLAGGGGPVSGTSLALQAESSGHEAQPLSPVSLVGMCPSLDAAGRGCRLGWGWPESVRSLPQA